LNWLLVNPPFPPETFGNLLLLYAKHGCYDLAGARISILFCAAGHSRAPATVDAALLTITRIWPLAVPPCS